MGKKVSNPLPPAGRRPPPPPPPPEVGDGHDYLAPLSGVCAELLPHAIVWKHTVATVVERDSTGAAVREEDRDEIEALQNFIDACQALGLNRN